MRLKSRAGVLACLGAVLVTVATGVAVAAGRDDDANARDLAKAIQTGHARNVIFFLGDGMGASEITVARDYAIGAKARFKGLDALPFSGRVSTYSLQEGTPSLPEYVTDSAAGATAWATGSKTSNGRLSTTAGTDKRLTTILELADKVRYATGNVSTAEITDATPAALDSHINARGCQGPADMASCPQYKKSAGGPGSIAEQTVQHGVDVVLGGGKARFDQAIADGPYAGGTVIDQAKKLGYTLVTDASGLSGFNGKGKLLGLFAPVNMTTEWTGALAAPYPGSTPTCNKSNRPASEPSLAAMTTKAIDLLEARRNDKSGFFLQVEGASIDKQDHAENPCAQIGETVAFDEAIQVGLAFQRTHPDTLIMITADHSHTSQIVESQSATDHSPGAIATLTTADGAPLVVNYATNLDGRSQSHTGADVPVSGIGPGAWKLLGAIDNTDLFHIMARAIGAE